MIVPSIALRRRYVLSDWSDDTIQVKSTNRISLRFCHGPASQLGLDGLIQSGTVR